MNLDNIIKDWFKNYNKYEDNKLPEVNEFLIDNLHTLVDLVNNGDEGLCFGIIDIAKKLTTYGLCFEFTEKWLCANYNLFTGNVVYPVPAPNNYSGHGSYYLTQIWTKEYRQNRMVLLECIIKNPTFKFSICDINVDRLKITL